jgi:hypothetical protein
LYSNIGQFFEDLMMIRSYPGDFLGFMLLMIS